MSNLAKDNPVLMSAILILISEFMFSSMAASIKVVSVALPTEVIVFFRNLIVTLFLLPWIWQRHGLCALSTEKLHLHFIRALSGLGAMYCFFYTLANMPLAEAALLKMSLPFFLPIIAWLWLGEWVSVTIRWAIILGFFGVAIILQPGAATFSTVALIALLGSALAALAKVGIRKMATTEPSTRIVFYFSFISATVSSVPLLWAWQTPDWHGWVLLLMVGVFGTCGQLLMTRAYGLAPSGQIGGFSYVAILFASLYGWLLWDEWVDHWFFVGACFVCLAGLMIMFDHQRSRRSKPNNDLDLTGSKNL